MRIKVPAALRQLAEEARDDEPPPPPGTPPDADWAMKTRPVTKQELADALARRQNRTDARERSAPYHQQASTWTDLRSALQAFCRGAGIELGSLTPEAQSMLPLLAGQLLREAVVGLIDLQQARNKDASRRARRPPAAIRCARRRASSRRCIRARTKLAVTVLISIGLWLIATRGRRAARHPAPARHRRARSRSASPIR